MTNEEIQQKIEAGLAEMSEEEREATLAADDALDHLMCLKLSRELQANIQTIPNDRHHIKVNDQVMGYNEYAEWQMNRYIELHPELADMQNSEEVPSSSKAGFFQA